MNSQPVDSVSGLLAGLSDSGASSSSTSSTSSTSSSLLGDFAKLLASQISLTGDGLETLGASDSSSDSSSADTFAALMAPASSGMGQVEALLMLRLIDALDRLVPSETSATSATAQAPSGLPVSGPISQTFHSGHSGIDIAVPLGTPVRATMAGKVAYAGWNTEGYGNLVIVENGAYRTYYAHLEQIPVAVGQTLEAGSVIGLSGSTGHSTGPHVHYEVRVNGTPVSPVAQS